MSYHFFNVSYTESGGRMKDCQEDEGCRKMFRHIVRMYVTSRHVGRGSEKKWK